MNLVIKISGPLKDSTVFFLAKGKFGNQEWQGVVEKKGDNAVLITHPNAESSLGKQKIVSYSGAIVSKNANFKSGSTIKFEEKDRLTLDMLLRKPRKETLADATAQLKQAEETIKKQAAMQEESNNMLKEVFSEVERMKEEITELRKEKSNANEETEATEGEPKTRVKK